MDAIRLLVDDEDGTRRLAEDVAAVLRAGDVIALAGDLGVGKSAFSRAVIRAVADDDGLEVPSPTFTLVQVYETTRLVVAHFDLYRISDPDELDELDFDHLTTSGAALIEWPDRADGRLPSDHLTISLTDGATAGSRQFELSGPESWLIRLRQSLAARQLADLAGFEGAERRHLQGDASTKSWERLRLPGQSAVMMSWPTRPQGPALADGRSYEEAAHIASGPLAMIAIGEGLRRAGIRAPRLLAEDAPRRLAVLEDLGANKIVDADNRPITERYLAAAEFLADMASHDWPTDIDLADGRHYAVPAYNREVLQTEVDLFPNWYLPEINGSPASEAALSDWRKCWAPLLDRVAGGKRVWCLRDYHSPNILWQSDGGSPIGVIDYQDTLIGPAAYDVASLITDARIDLPADLVQSMLDAYARRRLLNDPDFDRAAFEAEVAILSAQRNGKILGRFQEYYRRLGRTAHLKYMPRVRRNFEAALSQPVLAGLRLWYEEHVAPLAT